MKLIWRRGRKSEILLLSNSLTFACPPVLVVSPLLSIFSCGPRRGFNQGWAELGFGVTEEFRGREQKRDGSRGSRGGQNFFGILRNIRNSPSLFFPEFSRNLRRLARNFKIPEEFRKFERDGCDGIDPEVTAAVPAEQFRGAPWSYFRGRESRPSLVFTR